MNHDAIISLLEAQNMDLIRAYFTPANVNVPDEPGFTPLRLASSLYVPDNGAVILHLLECGADINAASYRYTPLHYAARAGKMNCMRALLSRGASVDLGDANHRTPLADTILGGYIDCGCLLLDYGASIANVKDSIQAPAWAYAFVEDRARARQSAVILMRIIRKRVNRDLIPLIGQWVWASRGN
jgi:ankyrin repeat protein